MTLAEMAEAWFRPPVVAQQPTTCHQCGKDMNGACPSLCIVCGMCCDEHTEDCP